MVNLDVHNVTHRIKSRESARTKAQNKLNSASIVPLTDLLGLRIITYFPDQVDLIAMLIEREFLVDSEKSVDKRAILDPDRFGYLSTHYVVSIGPSRSSLTEWTAYQGVKFEIQIRSILQHSWAEIEHDLGYKAPGSVPNAVRRRFSRLAGLLELADAEFVSIRDELKDYETEVLKAVSAGEDADINRDSVIALIREDPTSKRLDKQIAQLAGAYLEPVEDYYAADRSSDLLSLDFKSTRAFLKSIEGTEDWIVRFAAAWLVEPKPEGSYTRFGEESQRSALPSGIGLLYAYRHLLLQSGSKAQILEEFFHERDQTEEAIDLVRKIHDSTKEVTV
ncbi:ppGpp synthetase catalytic domain-containing protein (RelA/SpoT-type nucleotidyltranferase) [Cryobacterium levicorallinum]|nr:ppGpp synthetase catalytic domain-containing protein (RelA/SpoT-type nucleotidyltranferase) [Cryobacterium levicorallinum]